MQKISLLLALGYCGISISVAAPVNLVKDPGFEKTTTLGTKAGAGWWFSEGGEKLENKIDAGEAHGGKASLRLQADKNTKGVVVSQKFEVAPGDELSFQVWIKLSDVGANTNIGRAGLAFRRKDGNIIERFYFHAQPASGEWALISGTARAPAEAATAEAHLGYTNSPAVIWYDDVFAAITSPVSFSLVEGAQPWTGRQEITVRAANRQDTPFHGMVSCTIGKAVSQQPVLLEPNTSRDFKLPITLNGVPQHEYKIALVDTASPAATARVLQGKFRTTAALQLFPACPCYQIAGLGHGDTRFDAHINVNPVERAGLKLVVEVSGEDGRIIQTGSASAAGGGDAGLNLRLPIEKPAVLGVTARLMDRSGKEIASEKTDVHISATNEARVELGPDGFLQIDGSPNFPIGLYNSSHEEEMGKAGFTAAHNYDNAYGEADDAINPNEMELKHFLDKCLTNGMRAMVELPRKPVEKAKWAQVRRRIETFKYHPALLCWGSEERVARGLAPLKNITALYSLIKELDPEHPLVLGDSRDVIEKFKTNRSDFFPDASMDVGVWWWYPIPLQTADGNGLDGAGNSTNLMEPPSWLTTTHSQRPLWIAIQAYQKPDKEARFPTPEEYRCQSYLSIINGVKGIWFYIGSGQKDYLGKPAGLLNKPELAHWDYVQKLVGELRAFSPVIMSPKGDATLTISPANAPVEFTLRQSAGKTYLIAANKSAKPQSVSFDGAWLKDAKARVLYEEHPAAVNGESLADDFAPFGVHVYELETAK